MAFPSVKASRLRAALLFWTAGTVAEALVFLAKLVETAIHGRFLRGRALALIPAQAIAAVVTPIALLVLAVHLPKKAKVRPLAWTTFAFAVLAFLVHDAADLLRLSLDFWIMIGEIVSIGWWIWSFELVLTVVLFRRVASLAAAPTSGNQLESHLPQIARACITVVFLKCALVFGESSSWIGAPLGSSASLRALTEKLVVSLELGQRALAIALGAVVASRFRGGARQEMRD